MDQISSPAEAFEHRGRSESIGAAIGEIVEVTTTGFIAQCLTASRDEPLRLLDPPDFGAFVQIAPASMAPEAAPAAPSEREDEEDPFALLSPKIAATRAEQSFAPGAIIAVVSHARMTSLDADRRPTAFGYEDDDQLRTEQPQIFSLITTEFSGLLIGFADPSGRLYRRLPPKPPRLHDRVALCTRAETAAITEDITFLQRIIGSGGASGEASPEDLCAAILRHAWDSYDRSQDYLRTAGRQLSTLLTGNYEALQRILRSVVD